MKIVIKIKPPDFSKLFELRDVACMIAEEEERQGVAFSGQKRAAPRSSCRCPFKKLRSSDEAEDQKLHGWAESMTRMCRTLFPLASGQKQLTKTDVRAQSNRFLFPLPVREALSREMREWEKRKTHDEDGLPVCVLDRLGRKHRVQLANWEKNHWLVLKGKNYRRFVEANELEKKLQEKHRQRLEVTVGIWVFRNKEDDSLCFALVESE